MLPTLSLLGEEEVQASEDTRRGGPPRECLVEVGL